jgi:molybdopterin-biosynthesis enzyme MoeA-like protein
MPKFFALIIGSEILQGRREDKHFTFLRDELNRRGWHLSGTYIIEDDKGLMESTLKLIQAIPNSVIFSFGGIGATPDDYTREIAGQIFRNGEMEFHNEFREKIFKKFGVENSKHRVNMSYLPKDSQLLYDNPVNGMCGFKIDNRFFFVPGFPEMAHPMIREALNLHFPVNDHKLFSLSLRVFAPENALIDWMNQLPDEVTLSSLPKIEKDEAGHLKPNVEIKIDAKEQEVVEREMNRLLAYIQECEFNYTILS